MKLTEFARRRRAIRSAVAILAALVAHGLAAGSACAIGQAGAQFLRIPVGPKAASMGGAFVAVADDPSAAHWNPAGLASLKAPVALGVHSLWLQDMSYEYFSFALPTSMGSLGASVLYSGSGDMTGRDADFNETGTFGAHDLAVGVAFARLLERGVQLGLGAKLVQQKIERSTASALATDLGILCEVPHFSELRLGLAVRNLGSKPKFIAEAEPLPTILACGARYQFRNLILAGDFEKPRFDDASVHLGGELNLWDVMALRAGWRTRPGMSSAMTAGARISWHGISAEYAFLPVPEINATHTFGLSIRLEREQRDATPTPSSGY